MKTLYNISYNNKACKDVFKETLEKLMQSNPDVNYLDADLAGAMGTATLFKEFPNQAFDIGIMEANMIGVASGMSIRGKIPFVHSFAPFASRRCADQTFISACYNRANIKIIGSDPGISAQSNGGTHMPFEDISIYRSFPGMTILDIAEPNLLSFALTAVSNIYGVVYIRFPRKENTAYYSEEESFSIGKGKILREGNDATIIASGIEVIASLKAAEELSEEGINVCVVDMFTIKPIDEELIIECSKRTGAIVTAENHNIIGGLGSAVAEVLCENNPVPLCRIGVRDKFGEVGTLSYLSDKFHMTSRDIAESVKQVIRIN